jgi:hypothetical protein
MNAWCFKKRLPNIPAGSTVVMDNAPYYPTQMDKAPSLASKKDELIR